jgi:DNA primase
VDEVVILFDADEAGTNASLRALANLVSEKGLTVKVARLPEGLDPDEAVRADPALLEEALDEADDLIAFIIEQTLAGYERTSPAGQERAIRAAIKLLAKIPDKIRLFRELAQVAQRFGLPEAVLRDEVSQAELEERRGGPPRRAPRSGSGRAPVQQAAPRAPVQGFELHLLEALLALPDGAARVLEEGGAPQAFTPGAAQVVAAAIFQTAAEGPVEPARVMGRLEDSAARDLCGQLIGRIDPDKDYARDVAGWSMLQQRSDKKHRQALLRQIRATTDEPTKKRLLEQYQTLREGTAP